MLAKKLTCSVNATGNCRTPSRASSGSGGEAFYLSCAGDESRDEEAEESHHCRSRKIWILDLGPWTD